MLLSLTTVKWIQLVVTLLPVLFVLQGNLFAQSDYFTEEEKKWIKEHPTIKYGYEPDWPPYEIYKNGEYTGIVGEYVLILERETGIDFQPIPNTSWERSLDQLKTGEINFVPSCAITDSRKEFLDFTTTIVSDPLVIVTRKDSKFVGGLSYLQSKTIALPKNYYTVEMIQRDFPTITILQKNKITECLNSVSTGESSAFVGSLGVVSYYINHHGYTNLKIASPTKYDNVAIGMAVTKDWTILRDIAQKVIDRIPTQEHNDIRQKWISVRYEYGVTQKRFKTYIIIGIVVILTMALIFFLWNRSLKRQIEKRKQAEHELSQSMAAIKKQSEERKLLLQEIHHRVKNNLQIISSMLKLQAANCEENNIPFDFNRTIDRINAISLIHEMIYKSENISVQNIEDYLTSLINEIIGSHSDKQITTNISSKAVQLNLKTFVPIAIIVNELVLNSIKHGFKQRSSGSIDLKLSSQGDDLKIHYKDDGAWQSSSVVSNGFGTSLIDIFTEQLEGSYTLENNNGTSYMFNLKILKDA